MCSCFFQVLFLAYNVKLQHSKIYKGNNLTSAQSDAGKMIKPRRTIEEKQRNRGKGRKD